MQRMRAILTHNHKVQQRILNKIITIVINNALFILVTEYSKHEPDKWNTHNHEKSHELHTIDNI